MSKLIIIIIFFAIPIELISQNVLLLEDALNLRLGQLESKLHRQDGDFSAPWFDDIDIRSETRDFELRKQEYTIRFKPISIWTRSAQKELYKSNLDMFNKDIDEIKADYIEILYEDWLKLIFDKEIIDISTNLLSLYEDEEIVRKKMISLSNENIDKFIDFRDKKNTFSIEYKSNLIEYEIRKNKLMQILNIDNKDSLDNKIIDFENIKSLIKEIKRQNIFINTATFRELEIKSNIINSEIKIEDAENSQILDFLQFRYRGPHDDPMNERLFLTLALRMPLAGDNKMKTDLLKVEEKEIKNNIYAEEEKFQNKLNNIISDLEVLFSEYEIMLGYTKELEEENEFLTKNMATIANSPLWIISNQKNIFRNNIKILNISRKIYLEYIDLLSLIGVFEINPKVNYLKELPKLY